MLHSFRTGNQVKEKNIFMINEILPGNALDCRNFLALPSEKGLPSLKKFEQSNGRDIDIYSATIGPAIIEI